MTNKNTCYFVNTCNHNIEKESLQYLSGFLIAKSSL